MTQIEGKYGAVEHLDQVDPYEKNAVDWCFWYNGEGYRVVIDSVETEAGTDAGTDAGVIVSVFNQEILDPMYLEIARIELWETEAKITRDMAVRLALAYIDETQFG